MKFSTIPLMMILLVITGMISILMLSCSNAPRSVETISEQFIIRDFIPVANWHIDSAGNETRTVNCNKSLLLDYSNAITEGFIIPTQNQVREGQFEFSFSIKNTGKNLQKFFYKIFYQNESYKFPERKRYYETKYQCLGKFLRELGRCLSDL